MWRGEDGTHYWERSEWVEGTKKYTVELSLWTKGAYEGGMHLSQALGPNKNPGHLQRRGTTEGYSVLWHSLLIHRQINNSPVISTDHGMLISTDNVMLISTAWLNMTFLWTTEGRPRSGRPCFVHCIVMFSQAVEINMTWSVDINMPRSVDITGELIICR